MTRAHIVCKACSALLALARRALVTFRRGRRLVLEAVIVLLVRRLVRTAIDDQERRELRSLRNAACALVVGFHVALGASIAGFRILGSRGTALAFLLSWLGFGLGGGYLLSHRLPKILSRRRAKERDADADAFASAEARRRSRANAVLALSVAAFGLAFALIIYRA
jgi:hypothetical protein